MKILATEYYKEGNHLYIPRIKKMFRDEKKAKAYLAKVYNRALRWNTLRNPKWEANKVSFEFSENTKYWIELMYEDERENMKELHKQ